MKAIRLEKFTGLEPRTSARLLSPTAATTASNTNLLSGEIRGFHAPREAKNLTSAGFTVARAHRIKIAPSPASDVWLPYNSVNTDIVRSPIINDLYNRYYVTGAGVSRPLYNTLPRIVLGDPFLFLGVPAPTVVQIVTAAVGAAPDVTVFYVYTFVTEYGEEGPPSIPVVGTGDPQAPASSWNIGNLPITYPDPANRRIVSKRLYRTVPGNSSSLFYKVDDVPIATNFYVDIKLDSAIVLNPILESTLWSAPDAAMEGWVAMPNGFMVGWAGRRLMFSEPYRPHAWPVQYELATEYDIVGLGVWNDVLVIGTESQPYIGQGISPSSFTMRKSDVVEPCLSRRGIVSSSVGVYYPSPNGLMLVGGGGPQLVTRDIVTKDEWLVRYTPENMLATQYGIQYVGFVSDSLGIIFTPQEQGQKLVEIDGFEDVVGIETDKYDGQVYLLYENRAWNWDPVDSERLYWTWKSKEFHIAKPENFGAAKIKFDVGEIDLTDDTTAYYKPYNMARFHFDGVTFINDVASPDRPWDLGTINGGNCRATAAVDPITLVPLILTRGETLNGVQGSYLVSGWTEPENRNPIGGSLLYNLSLSGRQILGVLFRVYVNGVLTFERTVTDQDMIRLPTGFKRDVWQFEMISNSNVYSLTVGPTGKSLEEV